MIFVIDLETHLDDLEKIADIFERVFPGTFLVALTYDHNDFEFLNYLDNLHFNLILNPEHDLAYEITYNFAVHCWQSKI